MNNIKHIVVSGVNLNEGGTLTIFRDFLQEISDKNIKTLKITALVHKKELFSTKNINYIEFPKIKNKWIYRIIFEYLYCFFLSKKLKPDYWLSLHDITPNISSGMQFVYCHNPMCFYKMPLKTFFTEPKLYLFSKFYKYLYKINIKKNSFVITQQEWIKKEFQKMFSINNVIVAKPIQSITTPSFCKKSGKNFIYPALARFFKNHETLLKAWNEIITRNPNFDASLTLTIDGTENNYSKKLYKKYSSLKGVKFIGKVNSYRMHELYKSSDCLIFPSNLETWGLPLSEAQNYGLTIIASDLPYARETVGDYRFVSFFPTNDHLSLAQKIIQFSKGELSISQANKKENSTEIQNWSDLIELIINTK